MNGYCNWNQNVSLWINVIILFFIKTTHLSLFLAHTHAHTRAPAHIFHCLDLHCNLGTCSRLHQRASGVRDNTLQRIRVLMVAYTAGIKLILFVLQCWHHCIVGIVLYCWPSFHRGLAGKVVIYHIYFDFKITLYFQCLY